MLFLEFVVDALRTDLGQLVKRPQHLAATSRELQRFEHAVKDLAVVERDREVKNPCALQGGVNDLGDLGVGQHALGADRVEVALDEFAEPALGRTLATEDRADRIPLERHAQLVNMPGDEPGQRDGQVEPKRQLAGRPAPIGDLEDLPEHLVRTRSLAGQHFHALDVRGLDRHEAETGEGPAKGRQHSLTGNHHRGREVPQPAGHAGVDHENRILKRYLEK